MFARKSGFKLLLVVVGTLVLAGAFYAFADSNTVPTTMAGSGENTISGYTVSNVIYAVNVTTPTIASTVTFTLDGTAEDVTVRVDQSSNVWYDCSDDNSDNTWECDLSGTEVLVADMDNLAVVAYDGTSN